MAFPASPYIHEYEEGALRVAGTRVGLDTIVICFKDGERPEQIAESFPTVRLAQVYGAIAYYLDNQKLIDDYLAEIDRKFKAMVRPLSEQAPELYKRLEAARQQMFSKKT